ncbi:MAG: type III pantothenate kinase [Bacteroidetes bacterium]|nr:type III pantothenate kinase [Bacteroidota bacterium]
MYLTLDFGNTASKYALFTEAGIFHSQGIFHESFDFDTRAISSCIYCSVRNEVPLLAGLDCPVRELTTTMKLPIKIAYKSPETLGTDRLAAALGAHKLSKKNTASLIVDAGTCITFDCLSDDESYLGGSISPGLQMRYLALHQNTFTLPLVRHTPFHQILGQTTNDSILCGVQQGVLGEVERQIRLFLEKYPSAQIFLSGGDHPFLAEQLKTKIFVEPLLNHYGLLHTMQYHEKH